MEVNYERLVGPEYMLAAMRTTTGKYMRAKGMPKLETWHKMLLSPHSSHRAVIYRVFVEDIPYFAHVYLARHHVGIQPHVYTQRDDEGLYLVSSRNKRPQDELISMCFDVNAAALLQIAQRRLCLQAHKIIRNLMKYLKFGLIETGDKYDQVLGHLMMRPCQWIPGICVEPNPCGHIEDIKTLSELHKGVLEGIDGH